MIKLYEFDALRPEEILNRDLRAEKDVERTVEEISDLLYHLMVLLAAQDIPLEAVLAELERRSRKIGNLKQMKTVDHET